MRKPVASVGVIGFLQFLQLIVTLFVAFPDADAEVPKAV